MSADAAVEASSRAADVSPWASPKLAPLRVHSTEADRFLASTLPLLRSGVGCCEVVAAATLRVGLSECRTDALTSLAPWSDILN